MTDSRQPHVIVDEASTARIRGWALDPESPAQPVFLRFLVDGDPVWEGLCDESRADVGETHPSDRVGFDFLLPPAITADRPHVLTVEARDGSKLAVSVRGEGLTEIPLAAYGESIEPREAILSHLDSFRNGRVQGWVLRTVATPGGPRLLGGCTVTLVQDGRVIAQTVADIPRPDVADALQSEPGCGFVMEIPRERLFASLFRVIVMPERIEVSGSPCVITTMPGLPARQAPSPAIAPAPAPRRESALRCAVCVIARDEARDLPEWLAYQRALGFDAVIAYDNLSVDATPQILARAARSFDVRPVAWQRTGDRQQEAAYQDCIDRFGKEFDWIAFLDVDEFLVPRRHAGIKDLLEEHAGSAQVVINWATFGSNGHIGFPERLVIESFTRRGPSTFGPNAHVKSVVRPGAVQRVVNPHVMDVGDATVAMADGSPAAWSSDGVTQTPANHSTCQINHYFVRSRAHWNEKMRKGYHFSPIRRSEKDFADYDRNEIVDTTILRFLPAVRAGMQLIAADARPRMAEPAW